MYFVLLSTFSDYYFYHVDSIESDNIRYYYLPESFYLKDSTFF